MRTTVTLDKDVAARVRAEMSRTGKTFKEVVNNLVRQGAEKSSKHKDKPFRVRARDLGERPGLNYDNIGELLEQVEGPGHK
jgi:hypothetical protein